MARVDGWPVSITLLGLLTRAVNSGWDFILYQPSFSDCQCTCRVSCRPTLQTQQCNFCLISAASQISNDASASAAAAAAANVCSRLVLSGRQCTRKHLPSKPLYVPCHVWLQSSPYCGIKTSIRNADLQENNVVPSKDIFSVIYRIVFSAKQSYNVYVCCMERDDNETIITSLWWIMENDCRIGLVLYDNAEYCSETVATLEFAD